MPGQGKGQMRPQSQQWALAYRREGTVHCKLYDGLEVLLELLNDCCGVLHLGRASVQPSGEQG